MSKNFARKSSQLKQLDFFFITYKVLKQILKQMLQNIIIFDTTPPYKKHN